MRVPDKLSVDSARSELIPSENEYFSKRHGPIEIYEDIESTPGYSPDMLTNADIQSSPALTAKAEANASASATVNFTPGANMDASRTQAIRAQGPKDEAMKYTIARISRLEAHVSRLSSHMRMLEQQQVVMGAAISLYVGYKIVRWLFQLMSGTEITFRGQTLMPTKATKEEEAAKQVYKRHLRTAFIVFAVTSVIFLAVGIYLVVAFGESIQGLMIFGAVLISLGIVSTLAGTISGHNFFRLLRSTSDSVAFYPKTAEALVKYPYPRQPRQQNRPVLPPRPAAEPVTIPEPTAPPQPASATPTLVSPPESPPDYAPPPYEEVNEKDY
ncbi:hypothetical protein AAHC03_026590 [Spirometra sp. Aus1]